MQAGPPVRHIYQPIVRIETREVIGYEALLRLTDEQQAVFEADASRDGVPAIQRFDRAALRTAALVANGLLAGPQQRLFLTITLSTLQAVLAGLEPWPSTPTVATVVWELPEDLLAAHAALEAAGAPALRDVEIALDELGAGDSDLRRLAGFPGAWVKLARGLIHGCHASRGALEVVRGVVAVASGLDQRVIAEGVESADEAAALADAGVVYAQGHLYGRGEAPRRARPHPSPGRSGRR